MNSNKTHVIITSDQGNTPVQVGNSFITSSSEVKFLGILIESKLNFNSREDLLRKKASQKLRVLIRIASIMSTNQKKVIMCSFIKS